MTESVQGRGEARSVALGAAAQVGAKVVALLLNVVATLAIIRHLDPAGYGDYVFVFGLAAVAGVIADLGLSKVAAREMAGDGGGAAAVLGTSIAVRLVLAIAAALAAQLVLALVDARAVVRVGVLIASLPFFTDALLSVVVVFQVGLAVQYEALVGLVAQALDTALILALVAAGAGLLWLVAAPALSGVVGAGLAIAIARRRFRAGARFDARRVTFLVAEALPTGLALLITLLYLRLDSVLLAILRTPTEVGIYGAAYKPIEYVAVCLAAVMTALFPLLARWRDRSPERYRQAYARGIDAMVAITLPAPVLLLFAGAPLITLVYAPAFAPAAPVLQLLAVALVLIAVNAWQSFALLAAGRQRLTLAYDVVALGANLALNLVLIPRYGYMGAAAAALGTGALITLASFAVTTRLGLTVDLGRLARAAGATALMAGLIVALEALGLPWWAAVPAGAAAYPVLLVGARFTTVGELRTLTAAPRAVPA